MQVHALFFFADLPLDRLRPALCTVAARGACRTLLACCAPLPPAKAPMAALHVGVGLVTGLPVRQPTAKGARAATQNQT